METSTQDQQTTGQTGGDVPAQAATQPSPTAVTSAVQATAPGQLKVIKRNGAVVPYTDEKIIVAITRPFSRSKALPLQLRGASMKPSMPLTLRLAKSSNAACPRGAQCILKTFRIRLNWH